MTQPVLTEIYATGLGIAAWAPDEAPTATTPHVLRITGVGYADGYEYETDHTFVLGPEALHGLVEQAVEALAAAGQLKLRAVMASARAGRPGNGGTK